MKVTHPVEVFCTWTGPSHAHPQQGGIGVPKEVLDRPCFPRKRYMGRYKECSYMRCQQY